MKFTYKARRRLSLFIVLVFLPCYIVAAVTIITILDRPPAWLEFIIYVLIGISWIFPFKFIFRGIGQHEKQITKD